ncbi:MAG: ATP-binding cassette domain-containing protein [Sphingomonadales bacterium]|nr:ATP-binding cassette domain-containing protein [Sphingomonadales bacterium]
MGKIKSPLTRILELVKLEKSDISAIYFYAVLNGLILLTVPLGIQSIVGFVLGASFRASIYILVFLVVMAVLISGLMQINQMKIIEKIQQRLFVRYTFAYSDTIPRLDLKKNDGVYLPELINRFFDTATLQKSLSKILLEIPTATIQIFFGLLLLSFYHPTFIIFSIVVLALLWAILYFTGNRGLDSSLQESAAKYKVAAWLEEMARVVKTIKIATTNGLHLRKTDEATVQYLEARNEHFKILLLQYRALVMFKTTITAAMLIFGSILLVNQQLNIGQFIAAEIVILTILNSVEKLIINLDSVYDTLTAVDKLAKLTDKPLEQFGNITLEASATGVKIEAKDLRFSYPGRAPIFDNIELMVLPGQTVCVTGKGGSGKSTLLRLLDGAFADFEGILKIDDIPLRNYELSSLRSHIGIVLHQDDIFAGTLWENITMGKEGVDIKRVVELLDKVGLSAYFASLPQGFDTVLDPMGQRLPEQIIHNIMLVRAVAGSPRLLLLEEPWSGMEDSNRAQIIQLLSGLRDITTIVVSNDDEFAATCDQVLRMEGNGRLTKIK